MKERILTCIICPRGCELRVSLGESGAVEDVAGNACPRGEVYAVTECTSPMRTVTTTVRCEDGGVVPVKTSAPVPKGKMSEVMREVSLVRAANDVRIGDVVIKGVAETDSDIVVTGKKAN